MMPWVRESAVLAKQRRVKLLPEADYHSDEENIKKESKKSVNNLVVAINKFQKQYAIG